MDEGTCAPEQWRPVVGHEGRYEVSDQGRVRSVFTTIMTSAGHTKGWAPRILKSSPDRKGYEQVGLGARNTRKVHQLVLEAFVGPKPTEKSVVRHANHNPADNRLVNLSWGSYKENMDDMLRAGRNNPPTGSRNTMCRFSDEQIVQALGRLGEGWSIEQAAASIGMRPDYLREIKAGRRRQALLREDKQAG